MNLISGLAFLLVSVFVAAGAVSMSLGSLRSPGPGLYPLILAILLGIFSLLLCWVDREEAQPRGKGVPPATSSHRTDVYSTIGLLLAYAALLPSAGFSVVTLVSLVLLFKIGGIRSWRLVVLLAIAFTVGVKLLAFVLGTPLPQGFVWPFLFPQLFEG